MDNGTEFADHERLTRRLDLPIDFAAPYSPHQCSSNENTNGLLRQFRPKHRDFSDLGRIELESHVSLPKIQPRKHLNSLTPSGCNEALAPFQM